MFLGETNLSVMAWKYADVLQTELWRLSQLPPARQARTGGDPGEDALDPGSPGIGGPGGTPETQVGPLEASLLLSMKGNQRWPTKPAVSHVRVM